MSRPGAFRLALADLMILVGMTGFGLACYVLIDNELFRGQRYLFGMFDRRADWWTSTQVMNRAAGGVSSALLLFGGWTIALPVMWRRTPRPERRRLIRQPGVTACVAALTGMAFCALIALVSLAVRRLIDGQPQIPMSFWVMKSSPLDSAPIYAGISVAAIWTTQALAGCWRPTADWVDRLGRFLGIFWLLSGFVFAVRLLV
jgi:hypothetical protein